MSPRKKGNEEKLKTHNKDVSEFSQTVIKFLSDLNISEFFNIFLRKIDKTEDSHERIEDYDDVDYLDENEDKIE